MVAERVVDRAYVSASSLDHRLEYIINRLTEEQLIPSFVGREGKRTIKVYPTKLVEHLETLTGYTTERKQYAKPEEKTNNRYEATNLDELALLLKKELEVGEERVDLRTQAEVRETTNYSIEYTHMVELLGSLGRIALKIARDEINQSKGRHGPSTICDKILDDPRIKRSLPHNKVFSLVTQLVSRYRILARNFPKNPRI